MYFVKISCNFKEKIRTILCFGRHNRILSVVKFKTSATASPKAMRNDRQLAFKRSCLKKKLKNATRKDGGLQSLKAPVREMFNKIFAPIRSRAKIRTENSNLVWLRFSLPCEYSTDTVSVVNPSKMCGLERFALKDVIPGAEIYHGQMLLVRWLTH